MEAIDASLRGPLVERAISDPPAAASLMAVDDDGSSRTLRGILPSSETPPREPGSRAQPLEAEFPAPEGVTFRHETDAHGRTRATFVKNGKEVGSADIRDFGHSIQITNFQIARGSRRQGIGTAFQSYIEAQLGKRSVPDTMLSKAEYRRWKKVDPVAVRDYVKGTKSYTPRMGSDAYVAAHGGPPVPGSRASQDCATRAALLTPKRSPAKPGRRRRAKPSGATAQVPASPTAKLATAGSSARSPIREQQR